MTERVSEELEYKFTQPFQYDGKSVSGLEINGSRASLITVDIVTGKTLSGLEIDDSELDEILERAGDQGITIL